MCGHWKLKALAYEESEALCWVVQERGVRAHCLDGACAGIPQVDGALESDGHLQSTTLGSGTGHQLWHAIQRSQLHAFLG